MASEPKHRQISQELLVEIASGKFGASGRLPSEAQLVMRFAVSRPTVARALRDLQEQGLIERRVGSGSYVSKPIAAARKGLRQLGLLIPGLGTTEIFEVIGGELAGLARTHEYGLLWGGGQSGSQSDFDFNDIERLCEQFIRAEVSGVFFAPIEHSDKKEEANLRLIHRLQGAGITVVLLDRDLAVFPTRSSLDLVGVDNFAGGYLLADHLLKLGCRRLVYLIRPFSAPTVAGRIAGARAALLDHGLPVPTDFVCMGNPQDRHVVHELTAIHRADAVMCANDRLAAELQLGLSKAGIRVPHDLRVVGFDDVRYGTLLSVPLTTMHQPCREIASIAFRTMLERITDPSLPPRSIMLAPSLVVRESCGAYIRSTIEEVP